MRDDMRPDDRSDPTRTIRLSVNMAEDLAHAGIEATDEQIEQACTEWLAAAERIAADMGYAADLYATDLDPCGLSAVRYSTWTETPQHRDSETVEQAIWQAGHDAVRVV